MRKVFCAGALAVLLAGFVFGQSDSRPDALANYRAGREAESAGRPAEATRCYDEAVRICLAEISDKVSTMDTYAVLAWTLQRQRKYNEVITWGERALKIADDYRVIETMGEAYFYLDKYTASLQCMQRYVNALPDGTSAPTAYFFIGEIYRIERKFHYADIAYTTAVRLNNGNALWWYRLGLAREAAGETAPAAEAYTQARRLDPASTQYRDAAARVSG